MKGLRSAQLALRSCSYHGAASLPRRASAIAPTWWTVNSSSSSTTTASTSPRHAVAYFSTSPAVHAKKHREKAKKAASNEKNADEWDEDQLPSESRHKTRDKFTPPSDFDHEAAFDLGDVDTAYAKIDERFEKRLQEFKASGGRFNPDMLGQLKVKTTGGAEGAGPTLYPLRELASIVHRGGRSVSLLVSDASYIKPIMSAVQNSEQFNQQPQRDPDNDLELLLRIEPENPDEQAKRLKAECNGWKDAVRDVLATRKSKHATWQKAKHLTKDDVKNLDKKVKSLQDKKIEAIEKKEKQLLVELSNRQKRL